MRRVRGSVAAALALAFVAAGAVTAYAQAVFKVPYPFEAGGKKLPAGEYRVTPKGADQIVLSQAATGKETAVPVTQRLARPTPPPAEPRLVFDAVGNFEPSYTEYFTVYVLAEVWLPGEDGYLIHVTKGAHKNETVKGQVVKK